MAQYNDLKQAIQAVIRTNGNEEITGALLQQSLLSMVNSLGAGYQFMGVATPSTNPGTPDQKVFYIAAEAGDYSNFGNISIPQYSNIYILKYDTNWVGVDSGIASNSLLNFGISSPFIEGYGLTANGERVSSNSDKATDYIYIRGYKKILVSSLYSGCNVAFYDERKKTVAISTGSKDNSIISVPIDAVYVVVEDVIESNVNKFILPPIELDMLSTIERDVYKSPINKNLFTESTIIRNTVIEYSSLQQGAVLILGDDAACDIVKIPVKPNQNYAMSALAFNNNGRIYCLVDENNIILNNDFYSDNRIIQGYNAAKYLYIQLKYNNSSIVNLQIEEGNNITSYVKGREGVNLNLLPNYNDEINGIKHDIYDFFVTKNIYTEDYKLVNQSISTLSPGDDFNTYPDNDNDVVRIELKPNTKYAVSAALWAGYAVKVVVDINGKIITSFGASNAILQGWPNAKYLYIHAKYNGASSEYIQVEEGDTVTSYVAARKGVNPELLPDVQEQSPINFYPYAFNSIKKGLTRVKYKLINNLCNTTGIDTILNLDDQVLVKLLHSPASTDRFYQKENQEYESDLYMIDLPMANMETELQVIKNNNLVSSVLLNGSPYQSLLRQTPAIMIQLVTDSPNNYTNLKLFTDVSNGVVTRIYIKRDTTTIWQKSISAEQRVCEFYTELKEELSSISGYEFKTIFSNCENLTMGSMVGIKSTGHCFVTSFSDNCKTSGQLINDTYPVILDFQEDRVYSLDIAYDGNKMGLYLDDTFIENSEMTGINVNKIIFGDAISVISYEYIPRLTLNPKTLIHGYTSHAFFNDTSDADAGFLTGPIGSVSCLADKAKKQGFCNKSVEEIGMSFINNEPLPNKCYFIEVDDFATLQDFQKMLSTTDPDGQRVMEILKMHGLKMGFAQEFSLETQLINAIIDGTATEEQKNTLSSVFSNEKVYKIRAMMASYGWTISVHTLVDNINPTTARYDDFVNALHKTIICYERMYQKSPKVFVTSGTGNSSPYFRRLFPMFGLPIVVQDNEFYCNGSFITYTSRGGIYKRPNVIDVDYNILTPGESY